MKQYGRDEDVINRGSRYMDLSFEYHVAALSLWNSIADSPYLYNPCMFLARQTIELLLKGLIYRECGNIVGAKIGSGKEKRSIDNTHNLLALWDYYVQNMQPRLLPSSDDVGRIGKAIKQFAKRDNDSTKYRYPETKNPKTFLNLEPIRINHTPTAFPELGNTPPILVSSQSNKVGIVTSGATDLKRGYEVFELIEMLFQMAEV